MEIVRSLNRSWNYDTYFSLYRPIHSGEKSGGNVRGKCPDTGPGTWTLTKDYSQRCLRQYNVYIFVESFSVQTDISHTDYKYSMNG